MLAVVGAAGLTACGHPADSAARSDDVAWVATGASVTRPGMTVQPVDLSTRELAAPVTVGSLPSALAYTADDAGLLVVTQGDDMLHEIDPATHDVVHAVGVGLEPDAVAVAPGGSGGKGVALVANRDADSVTPVDLGTWRAGRAIPVGRQPVALAVYAPAAGTATAFVADFGSNAVTPIDVATLQPGPAVAVGPGPQAIAVAASEVLVGNFGNRTLTPIDAVTRRPGKAVSLPLDPTGIAIAPSAATAYVCGGAGIVPVTTPGLAVGTPVALPDVAQGIALGPGGDTAWVTQQAGSLVEVTLATGAVGPPLHLGGHPSALVIGAG
jgi:DNA-binding beta-propeller fold protein YncE